MPHAEPRAKSSGAAGSYVAAPTSLFIASGHGRHASKSSYWVALAPFGRVSCHCTDPKSTFRLKSRKILLEKKQKSSALLRGGGSLLGRKFVTSVFVPKLVDLDDLLGTQSLHDVSQDKLADLHAGLFGEHSVDLVEGLVFAHLERVVHAVFDGSAASRHLLGGSCHFVLEFGVGFALGFGDAALLVDVLVFEVRRAALAGELVSAVGALHDAPLEHLFEDVLHDKVGHVDARALEASADLFEDEAFLVAALADGKRDALSNSHASALLTLLVHNLLVLGLLLLLGSALLFGGGSLLGRRHGTNFNSHNDRDNVLELFSDSS